jgi:hypothetical protein
MGESFLQFGWLTFEHPATAFGEEARTGFSGYDLSHAVPIRPDDVYGRINFSWRWKGRHYSEIWSITERATLGRNC